MQQTVHNQILGPVLAVAILCAAPVVLWGQPKPTASDVRLAQLIYIEDSPAAQELVDQARHLRRQDRVAEAADVYQQVITDYSHKLLAGDSDLYVNVRHWV